MTVEEADAEKRLIADRRAAEGDVLVDLSPVAALDSGTAAGGAGAGAGAAAGVGGATASAALSGDTSDTAAHAHPAVYRLGSEGIAGGAGATVDTPGHSGIAVGGDLEIGRAHV